MSENDDRNVRNAPRAAPLGRAEYVARCANDACPRPAEPGDAYCASCGLERSLFTRRGGERESGAYERPVR